MLAMLDGNDVHIAMIATVLVGVVSFAILLIIIVLGILLYQKLKKYRESNYYKYAKVLLGISGFLFFVSPVYKLLCCYFISKLFECHKYTKYLVIIGLIASFPNNFGRIKTYNYSDTLDRINPASYIMNYILPEEEVMNVSINILKYIPKKMFPVKGYITDAFYDECKSGEIKDFINKYSIANRCPSGIYSQLFNDRSVYVISPRNYSLSNGGTLVNLIKDKYSNRYKSISFISCSPHSYSSCNSVINLIGGGKDGASNTLPGIANKIKSRVNLFWDKDYNHFVLVNKSEDICDLIQREICM